MLSHLFPPGILLDIIDMGPPIDNAMYQALIVLASLLWVPHAILFTLSRYLLAASTSLAYSILPLAIGIVVSVIESTGLGVVLTAIALALVGLGYLLEPYIPEFRMASLGKVIMFGILISIVMVYGPDIAQGLETARLEFAKTIADTAFADMANDPAFNELASQMGGGSSGEGNAICFVPSFSFGGVQIGGGDCPADMNGDGRITSYDAAAAAVPVFGAGSELSVSLPTSFRRGFFPYSSIDNGQNADQRTEAKEEAWKGVTRMALTLPVTFISLLDSVASILLSVAASFVLLTLPLSLLFSVFLPFENMATTLLKMYQNLFMQTAVVAVFTAVGMAAQLAALQGGSLTALLGASAMALLMELFAIKAGFSAVTQAFSSFGNSLSTNLGMAQGGGVMRAGASMALGAATGGAGLAMLSMGHMAEGTTKGGLMSLTGGALMARSPLKTPAMAFAAMKSQGTSPADALAGASTAQAAQAGLSMGGSPWSAMYAFNQLAQGNRRGAQGQGAMPLPDGTPAPNSGNGGGGGGNNSGGGSGGNGGGGGVYQPSNPWADGVYTANAQFGEQWVEAVRSATQAVAEDYHQDQGMDAIDAAAMFAGQQGQPALSSPGGRELFNRLPQAVRDSMNDPDAREAMRAVIGDTVAPRISRSLDDIATGVGVAAGGSQRNRAENAAQAMGLQPQDLGGYYGPTGRFVGMAQQHGLDRDTVEQLVRNAAGGQKVDQQAIQSLQQSTGLSSQDMDKLVRAAQLLPGKMNVIPGRLPTPTGG